MALIMSGPNSRYLLNVLWTIEGRILEVRAKRVIYAGTKEKFWMGDARHCARQWAVLGHVAKSCDFIVCTVSATCIAFVNALHFCTKLCPGQLRAASNELLT